MLTRDTRSLIIHDDHRVVTAPLQRDRHRLPEWTELHRVVEEIEQDLPQRRRIHDAHHVALERRLHHDVSRPCHRSERLDRLSHLRAQLDRDGRQSNRLTLCARELEDVLDEMRQTSRFLIDDLQRSQSLLLAPYATQQQRFREHANLRQWRAQLVRYARDEIRSKARQLALAPQLHDADRGETHTQREHPKQEWQSLTRQFAN